MASNYIFTSPPITSSPGFSFGRSGTCNAGTYLQIDGVPSNKAGRVVPFSESNLNYIFLTCDADATFSIEVQTRVSNVFTTVYTLNVTASRTATAEVSDVPFLFGDEVCVKIGSGTVSNVVVGLLLQGVGYG